MGSSVKSHRWAAGEIVTCQFEQKSTDFLFQILEQNWDIFILSMDLKHSNAHYTSCYSSFDRENVHFFLSINRIAAAGKAVIWDWGSDYIIKQSY